VGVGAGDAGHVAVHELVLVRLGLVGLEGLLRLPALEGAEPAGLLEILGPPVVDAAVIPAASCGDSSNAAIVWSRSSALKSR
jgi:hypothetical protein